MNQPNQDPRSIAAAASSMPTKVNLLLLKPGERVQITGGLIAEVVENPQDGMWIRARYISVPGNPSLEGTLDQIFAGDVTDKA